MIDKLFKMMFVFSILSVFFVWGFFSHWKEIFPFELLREAKIAYFAMAELVQDSSKAIPRGVDFWDKNDVEIPSIKTLSQKAGPENIFMLGNEHCFHEFCPESGALAWIMSREGKLLHVWKNTPNLWAPLENRSAIKNTWRAYPVGAYLFPNGDILVSYQGEDVFPIPMGLAKFDKDSNLIWKRNGFYHHWFSVGDDEKIYIGGAKIVESPLPVIDHRKRFLCHEKKFYYETICILDKEGQLIEEIDLFKSIIESDLAGLFNNNGKDHSDIETCDPLHLNDVRILTKDIEPRFPRFNPGDYLVSFRSLNGVGVIDKDSKLFKWFNTGAYQSQHSPRFQGNNRVFIFDNFGGLVSKGTSRVVGIDVNTGKGKIIFPKKNVDIPDRDFFSETAGHIEIHPDHKRMLVSWTHQGLVWEIDIENGEVLWEVVNTHPIGDRGARVSVYTSLYVDEVDFPMNMGKLP